MLDGKICINEAFVLLVLTIFVAFFPCEKGLWPVSVRLNAVHCSRANTSFHVNSLSQLGILWQCCKSCQKIPGVCGGNLFL